MHAFLSEKCPPETACVAESAAGGDDAVGQRRVGKQQVFSVTYTQPCDLRSERFAEPPVEHARELLGGDRKGAGSLLQIEIGMQIGFGLGEPAVDAFFRSIKAVSMTPSSSAARVPSICCPPA